ncbi:MAG: LicD family protein [Clostridia bacterium]|nr:LicD family protein [Clostridia bacterium]
MPKVSVIVPVYNVEKYLPKCLDSLVNQTLDDCEIIVVNDGSLDNSQEIIDSYASEYPQKIKAFVKKNGGLSDARNFGMEKATGEFIAFVDSDDFVSELMFEKMYERAIDTDADIVVCSHKAVKLNKDNAVKNGSIKKIEKAYTFGKSIYESPEILAHSRSYAWNKLYKREVISGYKFPVGQYYEDSAVVYNILSSANKIELVNEPLYFYVTGRSGAITSAMNNKIFDIFKSCDSIIAHYKKIGKYDMLKTEIESICLMHIHARFTAFTKKGGLKLKLKYVDTAFQYIEKNFPNWQDNPYYLTRRSAKLATYPVSEYNRLRDSRTALKRYYVKLYIQRKFENFINTIKKLPEKFKKRIFGIPTISKADKNAAKELAPNELRELQLFTLDILKVVVDFCNKNNIRYYLSEGSLLGAIRHKGFIPWDDDMDIAMPRDDYEKFLKLWGKEVHNNCRLYHQSTYKKYYLTFAKVIFTGKCRFSSLIRQGLKSMNEVKGPGIDIFPLDETGPLSIDLLKRAGTIRKYRNILLTKAYYIKNPKKRKLYRTAAFFSSYKSLQKKITSLYTADRNKGVSYYTNFASAYNISKEIFPKDYFEPAKEVPFEDITVTVPCKSAEILTCIYGDFMTPPPKENRVCPHQYIVKK